jgi:hypothetical protein
MTIVIGTFCYGRVFDISEVESPSCRVVYPASPVLDVDVYDFLRCNANVTKSAPGITKKRPFTKQILKESPVLG